jgi:hypothetical protein
MSSETHVAVRCKRTAYDWSDMAYQHYPNAANKIDCAPPPTTWWRQCGRPHKGAGERQALPQATHPKSQMIVIAASKAHIPPDGVNVVGLVRYHSAVAHQAAHSLVVLNPEVAADGATEQRLAAAPHVCQPLLVARLILEAAWRAVGSNVVQVCYYLRYTVKKVRVLQQHCWWRASSLKQPGEKQCSR